MYFNGTNQIVLVSFKNIYIWTSYGRNMVHMHLYNELLAVTQLFLGQLG